MRKKRTDRRWTVMLVPHGSGSSRAVEVSQSVVKALVGIGGVLVVLFLVLGGTALSRGVNITRSRALERENQLLASEIQRMRERLGGLRDTLNVFGEREQALRLMAGLSPVDKDVQLAGIGGSRGEKAQAGTPFAVGADWAQGPPPRVAFGHTHPRRQLLPAFSH